MNIHWKAFTWHLDVSLHRRQPVLGVNSILPDGNHFLMWDFDSVRLADVVSELLSIQIDYGLPTMYILESSKVGNYHAYCLERCSWADVISIIAHTDYIDRQYFKLGIMRGYMTLRFTDKHDSVIKAVMPLTSDVQETVNWSEMENFERYWTLRRKHGN